jgi:hypothetical protein
MKQQVADVGDTGNSAGLRLASGIVSGVKAAATALSGMTITGVLAMIAALGAAATSGLRFNNSLEQATAKINAFTKDGVVTAGILDMIRERAAKTPFAFGEMANAVAGLMPAAKASGKPLEDLIGIAEVLAASNPAEGLEGAAFALREAVSGDFTSVIERFNLPRQMINDLKAQGVPALEAVQKAMLSMGFDASLVANMAQTMSGRWSTLKDTLTGLAASATKPLFDKMSAGLGRLQGVIDANMPAIQALADAIGVRLGQAFDWIVNTGAPAAIQAFRTISSGISTAWATINSAFESGGIVAAVSAAFSGLWSIVSPYLAAFATQFLTWIQAQAPTILTTLQGWGVAFLTWITPFIGPMIAQLGTLAQQLWSWIAAQATALVNAFLPWAQAFVAWIGPATVDFLQRWPAMFSQFLDWIGAQAGPLLAQLGEWTVSFLSWTVSLIPGLLLGLGAVAVALVTFIAETAVVLYDKLLTSWGPAFANWIVATLPQLGTALANMLNTINDWVTNVAAPWARERLIAVGTAIVDGIKAGITAAWSALVAWFGQQLAALPAPVLSLLGIDMGKIAAPVTTPTLPSPADTRAPAVVPQPNMALAVNIVQQKDGTITATTDQQRGIANLRLALRHEAMGQ